MCYIQLHLTCVLYHVINICKLVYLHAHWSLLCLILVLII